jgi:hypothetical protein
MAKLAKFCPKLAALSIVISAEDLGLGKCTTYSQLL